MSTVDSDVRNESPQWTEAENPVNSSLSSRNASRS